MRFDMVNNLLLPRATWLSKLMDPRRDIDKECGYPETVTIQDFKNLFLRGDIAGRVVTILPEESWNDGPQIFEDDSPEETEFEKAWEALNIQTNLIPTLERVDVLSGVGRYGVLLLGLDDGKKLNERVDGIDERGQPTQTGKKHNLLFVRPFDETQVTISKIINDTTNPRYGHPEMYRVDFVDTQAGEFIPTGGEGTLTTTQQEVHWTRIIHVADNRLSSDVYGTPRMEKVLNRLLDIRKIAGGSGEMFWKGGFPGLSLETLPGLDDVELDLDKTKDQLESYMNGLQRYLATVGMSAKSLSPQVADPTPHIEINVRLISVAMGIPWRVFMGSEAAQLASEQDSRAWNRRLARRREEYITPYIIRPLINRLVIFQVLPRPEQVLVHWPDLNSPSDKDKAEVAAKLTEALSKYTLGGVDTMIPPFAYLTLILGMGDDEARATLETAGVALDSADDLARKVAERNRMNDASGREDDQLRRGRNGPQDGSTGRGNGARRQRATQ